VLTGDARFIDEQAQQSLKADVLKVWLDPPDGVKADPAGSSMGSRKPRHVEATGNVVSRSREVNIHDTSRLVVWFKDVPASTHLPPAPVAVPAPAAPVDRRAVATPVPGKAPEVVAPRTPQAMPRGPAAPAATTARAAPGQAGPVLAAPDKQPPERPFDLSARSVEAYVLRSPIKNTIDQMWCEGRVHVIQEPAKAEEKGTDIKGDTLKMTAGADGGYFLVVTGDLAELQADKIYIAGPEVNIDQSKNLAWVYGDGAMKMDSETNFQGDKLARPVPLTVLWSKSMLFNGSSAEFAGNIQADQAKSRMACQHLQVFFDRTISLKQGNKAGEPAKVRRMVCDQEVRVEDSTYEGKKLVKYTSLEAPVLHMEALEPDDDRPVVKGAKTSTGNKVLASGPGLFKAWEPGSSTDLIAPDPNAKPAAGTSRPAPAKPKHGKEPAKKQGDDMKLTCVWFQRRMDGNNHTNTANFWEKVRVLNLPSDRHDRPVDLDAILAKDLPEGALFMSCDRLKVLDRPTNNKPNKQMEARSVNGSVYVQGREFYARAAAVYYNQEKEQVILDGEKGVATLYKVTTQGAAPEVVVGKKIIYWRSTGETKVIGAEHINGQSMPRK
jgi:hypothetical protein